jgi:thiol-disulfide isomerase/thioredoxin
MAHGGDDMTHMAGSAGTAKAGIGVGQTAPGFSLATLSGGTFAFPTGKPTAVWFTANGCRPCIPKAQALDRLQAAFGPRLAVLGVDINPTEGEAVFRDWLKEAGNPRFETGLDKGGQLTVSWGVADTSTVVITDASGKVVYQSSGEANEATFREALGRAGLS